MDEQQPPPTHRWCAYFTGGNEWRFLLLLYIASLFPRLLFTLLAGKGGLSLDEIEYFMLARNLAEGEGYRWYFDLPCTFRPPGYPFFLAGLCFVGGAKYYLVRVLQTLFIATQPVLTVLLARLLTSPGRARLAGCFVAFYPPLVLYAVALMPENIFISLLLMSLIFLDKTLREAKRLPLALSGLLLAAAILVRPSFTPFLAVLIPCFLYRSRNTRLALSQWATVTLIVLTSVIPWILRNTAQAGQFVYLDSTAGYNLYIGYNPQASGTFDLKVAQDLVRAFIDRGLSSLAKGAGVDLPPFEAEKLLQREMFDYLRPPEKLKTNPFRPYADQIDSDVYMSNWGRERALAFMQEQPLRALSLIPAKFMHFWNLEHRIFLFAYSHNFVGAIPPALLLLLFFLLLAPFPLLTLGALTATVYRATWNRTWWLLLLPILYFTALHSLTFGDARFHYPIIPLLAILAAQGSELPLRLRPSGWGRAVLLFALLLLFAGVWWHGIHASWPQWQAVLGPNGNTSNLRF